MEEILIRGIREDEIEQLIGLCGQHAAYEEANYQVEGKAERLKTHLFADNPSLYCLVAVQGDTLIGYATYMKQFSTWDAAYYVYMDCLYLSEATRGLGIGPKLMLRMQEESRKMEIELIQWQTPDFNTRAIKFYERMGAEHKSKERFFWEMG